MGSLNLEMERLVRIFIVSGAETSANKAGPPTPIHDSLRRIAVRIW